MAGSQGTSAMITFGGTDYRTGERYVSYESVKGGFGARPTKDGINADRQHHLQHDEHADRDPRDVLPAARGGLRARAGQRRRRHAGAAAGRARRLAHPGAALHASVCCERTMSPPFGLAGGRARRAGSHRCPARTAPSASSSARAPSSRRPVLEVLAAPGSGGYGPAPARPARLRDDVSTATLTPAAAAADYGQRIAPRLTCPDCARPGLTTGGALRAADPPRRAGRTDGSPANETSVGVGSSPRGW